MNEAEVIGLARNAIWMILEIGMPVMMAGLFVGLIVALFQALTQIQEMTLAFIPKIIVIFATIYALLPTFSIKMSEYMQSLSDVIIAGNLGG